MIHHLYGVYDQKAGSIVNTFMSLNDETAIRSFESLLTSIEDTVFTDSFSDFNLIKIADIDDHDPSTISKIVVFGNQYSHDVLVSKRKAKAERRAEIDFAYSSKLPK